MDERDDQTSGTPVPPAPRKRPVSVALEQSADGRAPRVVAAGKGAIAEQILALAFANGVKVREDADLAELLSAVELESEIPLEAFTAVAEILNYVYRANGDTDRDAFAEAAAWPRPAPQGGTGESL